MNDQLFIEVLRELSGGQTARRLSDELRECVRLARARGKASKLTFTLTLKPVGDSGQYELYEDSKAKHPDPVRGINLLWGTPEGNLSIRNPHQRQLNLDVEPTPSTNKAETNIRSIRGDEDE